MRTRIVILAGGKGKRMKSDMPKVLIPFDGKPLVSYVIDAAKKSGIDEHPVVVVGFGAEEVKKVLGSDNEYVVQEEQLGTGHAVMVTEPLLKGNADNVVVLYGDHPFTSAETLKRLVEAHATSGATITLLTVTVPDFEGWRAPLSEFGKIIRDENGQISTIVERKDATPEQQAIVEINPGFYCFKADWLWGALHDVENNNAQGEYYLTDLLAMAIAEGKRIHSTFMASEEAPGINTPEHLKIILDAKKDRS